MKNLMYCALFFAFAAFGQGPTSEIDMSLGNSLVVNLPDGRYTLSDAGASYFAKLSLNCISKTKPHYFYKALSEKSTASGPKDLWPSFCGCYDWHSSVHNHWGMIKILKLYPNIAEATEMRSRLNEAFNPEKILKELEYVRSHENGLFEFPYGQAWVLKMAEELSTWQDRDAQRWLNNLMPLSNYVALVHTIVWKSIDKVKLSGSHDSPAMALSFAYDYAVRFNDKKLEKVVSIAAMKYYGKLQNTSIEKEPNDYDFMSASLLVTDLMRKVMTPDKFVKWCKKFCPKLFTSEKVSTALQIKRTSKHDGYASHWDGYHLNRIWCLNGMLKSMPEGTLDAATKAEWVLAMNQMWDYAQESIGKGNYDIDHWLSSFSVFALVGYE